MPMLDSNLWAGTDPRMQQMQGMGMQGVPQLPPTLAAQLAQRAQMRMSPQGNPMLSMMAGMGQRSNNEMMPPFQPSTMPKPKEFWEQQFQPTDTMRSMSVQDAMPKEPGIAAPGQLPQMGGPQIPNNMQGMGLGANAPQQIAGFDPASYARSLVGNGSVRNNEMKMLNGMPGQGSISDMDKLKNQMFGAYMNLYPEGNL